MTALKTLILTGVLALHGTVMAAPIDTTRPTLPIAIKIATPQQAASAALSARLQALRTLSTEFTQTTQSRGTPDKVLTGTLQARKPGQFRWEVKQPFSQLIVADGSSVFIYDPDLAQLLIRPLGDAWGETPALLFTGNANLLAKQFSVRQSQQGALTTFHLSPRAKDSLFTELNLVFKGDLPLSMQLLDSANQRTEVAFFNAKRNVTLSNSRFQFTAPPGTDIIRE